MSTFIKEFKKCVYISLKDFKLYFLKGPNLTFGILLPVVLYLAFSAGREGSLINTIPGLISMGIFFGAGAIHAVSIPLEKQLGTIKMVLTTPTRILTIIFGKILAGCFFGLLLSIFYTISLFILSPSFFFSANIFLYFIAIIHSSLMASAFGVLLATPFREIPQAMPPATVIRIFMTFISGVFVPIKSLPIIFQVVAHILPLTYSVQIFEQVVMGSSLQLLSLLINIGALLLFIVLFLYIGYIIFKRKIE
ncbi:MAG: ABC transporter permease [Promethearchaeia archaeon]